MKRVSKIQTVDTDTNAGGVGMSTLTVVTSQSVIDWTAFKTGGQHHGTLQFKSGTVEVDPDDKRPVGGVFYFDMNSINDLDQEGKLKELLESDLKGSKFFDVTDYPEAKLELIKVDHTPDINGAYGVNAALTMKGIRNELTFKAKYSVLPDGGISVQTDVIVVDRIKWGITEGSKNIFKKLVDHIIADNFDVKATLVAR